MDEPWQTLAAAGVVDTPTDRDSPRARAIQILLDLGATTDELIEHSADLGYVAARIVNGTQPTMTRRQLADRCGLPLEAVERLGLATGIPDPGPDVLSTNERDIPMVETFAAAAAIFGEPTTLQLARVVGAATAKMGEAISSAYRAAAAPRAATDDPSGLAVVETNVQLAELLPTFMTAVQQLLRRHLVAAIRPTTDAAAAGYDSADLCVGFIDLVGSTALAEKLTPHELSAALSDFESAACDAVVTSGGRVVKLIGDEIMFTAPQAHSAIDAASTILSALESHSVLPPARTGIAFGAVIVRDGDCFGPTVNLAARLVAAAEPSQVLLDDATAQSVAGSMPTQQLGTRRLKGFPDPIPVFAVRA